MTRFKYFGAIVLDEGSEPGVLSRIKQATAALTKLIWRDNNISLGPKPRLTEKSKQVKLSLPKTRRRKSLIKSFSNVSSDQRLCDPVDC